MHLPACDLAAVFADPSAAVARIPLAGVHSYPIASKATKIQIANLSQTSWTWFSVRLPTQDTAVAIFPHDMDSFMLPDGPRNPGGNHQLSFFSVKREER